MDNYQLPDDALDFDELSNLSFDLDSLNSIDETSNQWLDELSLSIIFENNDLSVRKRLQQDQSADSYTEIVGVENNHSILKSARPKICLSKNELSILEREFQICHYPDRCTRKKLALALNLTQLKVSEWFTNRRIKMRKQSTVSLSSSDDYFEFISQANRIHFSKSQIAMLEREFQISQNPDCLTRQKLALMLGLRDEQVNHWFHNRRNKIKKVVEQAQLPTVQNMSTSSASETSFQLQDLTETMDINNNQLSTVEHVSNKDQSCHDVVCQSEMTLKCTNEQIQEKRTETPNLLLSTVSNQDPIQIMTENAVQTEISRVSSSSEPSQKRQPRIVYCKNQLEVLENQFKRYEYPSYSTICQLASTIKVSESHVRVWFKNRRAKQKKIEKYAKPTQSETVNLLLSSKPPTQKRKNHNFCERQLMVLEREFENCQHPNLVTICRLASKIKLTNSQVRRWFTIRRIKQRKLRKRIRKLESRKSMTNFSSLTESSTKKYLPHRITSNINQQTAPADQFSIHQYPEHNARVKLASTMNLGTGYCGRQRTNFSQNHLTVLENEFKKCEHPENSTLQHLASMIDVPHGIISNWFKNRRSKQRKLEKTLSTEISKPRRRAERINFNTSQLAILEHEFEQHQYLDYDTACSLATIMDVPYHKVRTWFVNRRAKLKKQNKSDQPLQQQTQNTTSSELHVMETQLDNAPIQRFESNDQAFVMRDDNVNNTPLNSIWHMSVLPQNLRCKRYNNTSPVFTQRGYDMPIIDDDEFYINPAAPSAKYVLSCTFDTPVDAENFIL